MSKTAVTRVALFIVVSRLKMPPLSFLSHLTSHSRLPRQCALPYSAFQEPRSFSRVLKAIPEDTSKYRLSVFPRLTFHWAEKTIQGYCRRDWRYIHTTSKLKTIFLENRPL